MDMNVDETGSDDESASVEGIVGFASQLACGSDFGHAAVFEQKIVPALEVLSGVDEKTVADCETAFIIQVQNLFSRECTRMNTNSFVDVLKNEPFEMGLWSKIK
jgi:hypothetical protein